MSALGSLVVSLALDYAQYTQGLEKSDQAALKFARSAQRNFDDAAASVKDFLKGTVAAAAGAVGALVAVNESFSRSLEFNKSIAQISTQIDGSIGDLNRLEAAARAMSAQFGTLPVEQTRAFYEIISSGTEDVTAATELLSAANKLAIGGMTDLATSVDGLTNIMNSYAGKVASAEAVSDALFVGMKAGKATMEEFSAGLGKVTPIASTLGVSFDELVATIAALSKQGISTQESITGVRAILASVAKPTKEARDMSEQLGIEFSSAGLQAKGFAGFLEDITSKTGGSADALALLFGGVEALIPIMALSGQAGEDFNQIMVDMQSKTGATQAAFEKMANSDSAKIDRFFASINNIAISLGGTLAGWLAPAAEAASKAINNLLGVNQLSAVEQQKQLISDLRSELQSLNDRKNIPIIGDLLFDRRQADLLSQRLDDAVADLAQMEQATLSASQAAQTESQALKQVEQALKPVAEGRERSTKATKVQISESQRFIESLTREAAQLGKTSAEIRKMEAAQLGVLDVASPLIDRIEQHNAAVKEAEEASRLYQDRLSRVDAVIESVATNEERFAGRQAELNDMLQAGEISVDVYNRALAQTEKQLFGVRDTGRHVFDDIDQFAIQAARNVQTAFADFFFDPFDKGLKGLVTGFANAARRLGAEILSVKTAQSLGFGNILGLGAGNAAASTGGGIGALDIANLGSSALGLFKGGFGLNSLIGGGLSSIGGSGLLGSFGAGLAGGSEAAAFIAAESAVAGAGTAAGLGASLGAVAGPLAAAAALTQVFKAFAGDKRMGGGFGKGLNAIGDIPILSEFIPVVPLMNALFGRGPLKQKETNLIGDFTAGGFEGVTSTKFKAQGGAFVSDKVDRVITDTDTGELLNRFGDLVEGGISKELLPFADQAKQYSTQLGKFLDESITPISKGLIDLADNLGLGKNALDDFSFSVNIASEKGQALKDEQIAEIIGDASEAMARKLVPEIDSLKRNGESAYQAVQRVNAEFNALDSVLQIIGVSAETSRTALLDMSIQQRSDLISLAGGVELLGQKSSFFFSNILTDADRLSIKGAELTEALKKFGVEGTLSVQQLRDIVLNNPLTAEQLNAAFDLAPLILEVDTLRNSAVEAAPEVEKLAEKIEVSFNETSLVVDGIGQSIQKLKNFVEGLKGSVNDILGVDSLTSARRNINSVLGQDRIKMNDLLGLSGSVQALGGARDTSQFSTRFDLIMSRAQDAQLVQQITGIAEERIKKLSQGLVTFLRGDDLPRFSSGSSFVPSTGPAIVHQGERIINSQQNQDLVDLLRQLVQKVSEGTVANVDLYRRLGNVLTETDTDGLALRTKAAT